MFVNKFWNFVWLVEVVEKYLATSGSPKVFVIAIAVAQGEKWLKIA